jgi:hypothetical protein
VLLYPTYLELPSAVPTVRPDDYLCVFYLILPVNLLVDSQYILHTQ